MQRSLMAGGLPGGSVRIAVVVVPRPQRLSVRQREQPSSLRGRRFAGREAFLVCVSFRKAFDLVGGVFARREAVLFLAGVFLLPAVFPADSSMLLQSTGVATRRSIPIHRNKPRCHGVSLF